MSVRVQDALGEVAVLHKGKVLGSVAQTGIAGLDVEYIRRTRGGKVVRKGRGHRRESLDTAMYTLVGLRFPLQAYLL